MSEPLQPIYLSGQTGSGKTAITVELATLLGNIEIINADAYQIYQGMPILSAAPAKNEKRHVPHHLFEFLPPSEECDAARFARLAKAKIEEVSSRGNLPLVVGGSGLYLKAITHGLAPTPKGDPDLRAELDQLSLEELVEKYKQTDPEGAETTNLKNRRYVTRNLEISILAGQPASQLKQSWENDAPDITAFYLQRERADIYDRINRRTSMMFESGVVDEVAKLKELSTTAEKAIGIREIRSLISGEIDEETCIEAIRTITRRYAKRQETWFKREETFFPIPVAPGDTVDTVVERILSALQS